MNITLDTLFVIIVASGVIGALLQHAMVNGKEWYIQRKYRKHLEEQRKKQADNDFKIGRYKREIDDND
jgi:hypothetical protein